MASQSSCRLNRSKCIRALPLVAVLLGSLAPVVSGIPQDTAGGTSLDVRAIAAKAKPSVVTVEGRDGYGRIISQGTGFFIRGQRLITNRHVLKGVATATIRTHQGREHSLRAIVAEDSQRDLLAALVDGVDVHELELSDVAPTEGTRVVVVGSPLGLGHTICDGIVSALRPVPLLGMVVQITAPISPGSSGSPILAPDGKVIGVATLRRDDGAGIGFGISAEHVARLRDKPPKPILAWAQGSKRQRVDGISMGLIVGVLLQKYSPLDALPYLFAATDEHPAEAWFRIGLCMHSLKRHADAAAAFSRSGEADPRRAIAWFHLGLEYALQDRLGDLESLLQDRLGERALLQARQPRAEPVSLMEQIWRDELDERELSKRIVQFLEVPGAREAEALLAYALSMPYESVAFSPNETPDDLEKINRSVALKIKAFEAAIEHDQTNAAIWYRLGLLLCVENRMEEALRALEQAARLEPARADILEFLATTLHSFNRHDEALEVTTRVLALAPESPSVHYLRGHIYQSSGRWSQAKDALLECLRHASNSSAAYELLSRVCESAGQCSEALEFSRKALVAAQHEDFSLRNAIVAFPRRVGGSGGLWYGLLAHARLQMSEDGLLQIYPPSQVLYRILRGIVEEN